jgi:Fe-S oxidoreductase
MTAWPVEEVKEVLDLCVSCKGCKRDCPTGVDMAKVKIEARAAWTAKHGTVAARQAGGNHAALCAAGQPLGRAARLRPMASRCCRLLGQGQAGTGEATGLPALQEILPVRRGVARKAQAGGKEVLLFVDTFNNYMEPENAAAARDVLEAAGYTVHFNSRAARAAVLRPHLSWRRHGR